MTPLELTRYLHQHIPLSAAAGAEVVSASDAAVVLRAPLGPNINHQSSVFGGSIATLAILSAWTWLHRYTRSRELTPTLVIQDERTKFLEPALGELEATCEAPAPAATERFLHTLERYARARLELNAILRSGNRPIARFRGSFVALKAPPPDFG